MSNHLFHLIRSHSPGAEKRCIETADGAVIT
jgi:hypothetical protein